MEFKYASISLEARFYVLGILSLAESKYVLKQVQSRFYHGVDCFEPFKTYKPAHFGLYIQFRVYFNIVCDYSNTVNSFDFSPMLFSIGFLVNFVTTQ